MQIHPLCLYKIARVIRKMSGRDKILVKILKKGSSQMNTLQSYLNGYKTCIESLTDPSSCKFPDFSRIIDEAKGNVKEVIKLVAFAYSGGYPILEDALSDIEGLINSINTNIKIANNSATDHAYVNSKDHITGAIDFAKKAVTEYDAAITYVEIDPPAKNKGGSRKRTHRKRKHHKRRTHRKRRTQRSHRK